MTPFWRTMTWSRPAAQAAGHSTHAMPKAQKKAATTNDATDSGNLSSR